MVRKANKRNDNSIDQSDCNADQLLQNLPDTILIVDYDGTIAMVHGQYTDMFGYMQEELLGQPVAKLIPMRYRFDHTKHISTFIDKPHIRPMGGLVELSALRKDGSVFTVDIMLSPLETADGRFAVAVIRDATDRQKAKEELHRIAYFDPLTDLPN
ncbi:MAG: PAS domain S-box protein, partial [Hyphomicrobiales bacterium]|nr:PAS domain S-box protein [Hyphomicrobiales bacterium]